jgi:hypothetical protein
VSDIFQEVEEDVRRERYEKLWKEYGNYIIVLAVLIVAAVAAWQVWLRYDLGQRQRVSDELQKADQVATSGNYVTAETELAPLAKSAPGGYGDLAKFRLAGVYLAEGKRDQSVDLLRQLTSLSDPILASAARLRLAWTLADASPKPEIVTLLQPLTGKDNPWRFAASEVIAYVDLKDGNRNQAITEYQQIAEDMTAPQTLRQRAAGISEFLKANPEGTVAPPQASGAAAEAPAKAAAPAAASPQAAQGKKP